MLGRKAGPFHPFSLLPTGENCISPTHNQLGLGSPGGGLNFNEEPSFTDHHVIEHGLIQSS